MISIYQISNHINYSVDATFQLGHLYEIGCADESGVVLHPDIDMAIRFYQEAGQKVNFYKL